MKHPNRRVEAYSVALAAASRQQFERGSYIEAYTVCEGVLDDERIFADTPAGHASLRAWADSVIADSRDEDLECEVYVIAHPHAEGIECECVQYLTDHSPYASTDDLPEPAPRPCNPPVDPDDVRMDMIIGE